MGAHTVISAAINSNRQQQQQQAASQHSARPDQWSPSIPHLRQIEEEQRLHDLQDQRQRQTSYGVTSSSSSASALVSPPLHTAKESQAVPDWRDEEDEDELEPYEVEEVYEPIIDVTWRYMSRMYLLVPVFTMLVFIGLVLLVTYAWPPSRREREGGQSYPHAILPWPFLTGLFASVTVQALRVPVWVVVSWLPLSPRLVTLASTIIHTILHELLRLATLPMIRPSPTSGFHSSYYLGLGWSAAEAAWGIVQGWDQLALYEDVMRPEEGKVIGLGLEEDGREGMEEVMSEGSEGEMDEAELERRVEILERMRARRDLEQVIGQPFPNIPFPFHLLWRLDTLLLNLGLTLILSAYYFNSYPIYRHTPFPMPGDKAGLIDALSRPPRPAHQQSEYLWVVWGLVVLLHVAVSLVWKVVGRVGIGAVTWGGLIVSLGSVFAGLGGWGGLV